MKHCTKRWTESTLRIAAFLAVSILASACVSQPKPQDKSADTPVADADAVPEEVALFQAWPERIDPKPVMLEAIAPDKPENVPAPASATTTAPIEPPSDVTILSPASAPIQALASGSMDEPVAPLAVPSPGKPAVVKPAVVTSPAPAATAPAATKPAPTKASPVAPAAPPAKPATPVPASPAFSLPSAPASSIRSEDPTAVPVADISVDAVRGQSFELRFAGTGWTYLGDEESRDGIRYETRRFQDDEVVFTLGPDRTGEYLLRFQRQDPVDGSRKVSLVRVDVREPGSAAASTAKTGSTTTIPSSPAPSGITPSADQPAAPSSDSAMPASGTAPASGAAGSVPAASTASGNAIPAAGATAGEGPQIASPATTPAVVPSPSILAGLTDPSAILAFARDELSAKRVRSAIDALDRYVALFASGSDEVYFLYGMVFEQDTPFRDIKKSYEYYKRVRDEYPRSLRWKIAAERVAYMERHYYGLR
ncbi:MAG: hypothetical protein E4H20_06480 [Spirochaetales bacterium]|nr:MAG: hypothetical protein E4H20_06480 [Spirochaetales bacterium]